MSRDERLKAISEAHDSWVEGLDKEGTLPHIPPDANIGFEDANQFSADLDFPQEEFLKNVPPAEEEPAETDALEKAIEGLSAVLDVLKAKNDSVR